MILQTYVHAPQHDHDGIRRSHAEPVRRAAVYLGTGMVVDQTGLSGEWDFDFRFSQKSPASAGAVGIAGEHITIFDAINTQLGLRLEAAQIPTPVLVVDRVNRTPGDNPPGVAAILLPPPPAAFEVAALRLSDPELTGRPSKPRTVCQAAGSRCGISACDS